MGTPPERGIGRPTAVLIILATITAVAAILVLVTLFAAPDDDGDEQARDDSSEPATPPECPPAPVEGESDPIDEIDPDAPEAVPTGATSVRLCQGLGTELTGAGAGLTDGVDELVAAINALETTGEPEMCTADIGPGYRMVFGYPDGTTFTVSGRTYGCQELVVGSSYRAPATEVLDLFREFSGEG